MQLTYPHKKSAEDILEQTLPATLPQTDSIALNMLIQGDNLAVMQALRQHYVRAGTIDLVYIDPPFATNTVFRAGEQRSAHVSSRAGDPVAYSDTLLGADFLEFLRERLILIRELMSEHSSIYLHIDYKIGHYVKVLMDEVFGANHFRNDITRIKCNPKNFQRSAYGNVKDMILYYTKTDDAIWNEPSGERDEEEMQRLFPKKESTGRAYTTTPLHAPGETANGATGRAWKNMLPPTGRHWRYSPNILDELDAQGLIEWSSTGNPRKIIYADELLHKKKMQDIWDFKDPQHPLYPTEKNIDLLKMIIRTSSNQQSTVLDCFCGSGSTLAAAQQLGRHWIGIDSSPVAIATTLKRLKDYHIQTNSLFSEENAFTFLTQQ